MLVTDEDRAIYAEIEAKMEMDQRNACREYVAMFEPGGPLANVSSDLEGMIARCRSGTHEQQQLLNVNSVLQVVLTHISRAYPDTPDVLELEVQAPV